jgi:hypothetical protein
MVAPIDSSQYWSLIGAIDTFPTRDSLNATVPAAYTEAGDFEQPQPDLSGYYSDPETTDLYTQVANNVKNSADAVNNALMSALENGYGVQDAVNITLAMRAYQANCAVAKSTFELKI